MQILFLLLIFCTCLTALYYSLNNRIEMLYFFLLLVMFQNIIVIIFSSSIPNLYNVLFSIIKEMMLYIALIASTIRKGKIYIKKNNQLSLIFLGVYLFMLLKNLFITTAGLNSSILSLRYMLVPVLCIYVGKNINIDAKKTQSFLHKLVFFSIVLSLFGMIEQFVLGDSFWNKIGYKNYAIKMKGNMEYNLFRGVTVNFYTWDFGGIPIRRMVSITADPLATAFLIYLGVLIIFTGCISFKNKRKINGFFVILIVLSISSFLSLSKAIFVLIGLTFWICAYFYNWMPKSILRMATMLLLIVFIIILKSYVGNTDSVTSSLNHVMGLLNGLSASNLTGNGLGTAGSSVIMLTGVESNISESYIGALFAQVGLIGGIAFLLFIYEQIKRLFKLYRIYKNKIIVLASVCMIGILVCMIFSDSSVSIMGTGIYFIIIGLAQRANLYEDVRLKEHNVEIAKG